MKLIKLALLTSLLSLSGAAIASNHPEATHETKRVNVQKTKYDFRKSNWGMSLEEIKASEKTTVHEEKTDYLSYVTPMGASTLKTEFFFVDNKLAKIESHINQKVDDFSYYLTLYNQLLKIYTKKLGEPKTTQQWSHVDLMDEYDRPNRWIVALEEGHVGLVSEFNTNRTNAVIILASPHIYFDKKYIGLNHILTVIMGDASLQEYPE